MSFPPLDDLIPHRPPMRLIEEIVGEVDGVFVCRGAIPTELAFDGFASPMLGIEMGAQAAAVMAALDQQPRGDDGQEPAIGYLVSIRAATFETQNLPAEQPMTVSVRSLGGVRPLASYEISITPSGSDESCLSATIGTYQKV